MTQAEAILAELQSHPGEWVSMHRLYQVSGAHAVHSRIADLRADGHPIDNRILPPARRGGPKRSEYRLTASLTQANLI